LKQISENLYHYPLTYFNSCFAYRQTINGDYYIYVDNLNEKKEVIFYIKGMHCASCELNIERKLLKLENVKSVEASLNKGEVVIEYENAKPKTEELNNLFKQEGYQISGQPVKTDNKFSVKDLATILIVFILASLVFVFINKLGLSSLINVNAKSSLPAFLFFGVLAGASTCAALVGGIILSMSKQWPGRQPHIYFNFGRILSYGFFGALLGLVGSKLQISLSLSSALILAISFIMIFLAFDMLGISAFRKFQITSASWRTKFITRRIASEKNFKRKQMPLISGILTFFLPCGFTLTAQSAALLSASPIQGGLIMLFFSLGTAPILLLIGLTSAKFLDNPRWSSRFLKIAGALVLFFALFNINSQLNVFGLTSLNDIKLNKLTPGAVINNDLPLIIDGKQIVKMTASANGYNPSHLKAIAGIPIRWEITDIGTSGCTSAIIAKDLFSGKIYLTPGQTSVKEFTIAKHGTYKFTCWMGMVSGIFEVI
jgi:sulfite exporter TauE/SafE/copper chaperone CopZ/plastocyanin